MIEAFIFDYGNVISVVDMPAFVKSVQPYAVGPNPAAERLARTRELMMAYESGKTTTAEFVPAFLERAGLRMNEEEFIRHWSAFFRPIPFTRALIQEVKLRYRVGLLSNTNPLHFEHVIAKTDIFPLFDAVTLSYEAGVMKPDPRLYWDMLTKLNVAPDTCVFLDDMQENIDAAVRLGMRAILFTTVHEVARQIHQSFPELKLTIE